MTYDTMPKGRLNMVRSCGQSETLRRFVEALVSIKPSKLTVLLARGTKLHIYMDHTFVAQHIKV